MTRIYFSRWRMITRSYKIHLFVVTNDEIYIWTGSEGGEGVFCDQLSMNSVSSGLGNDLMSFTSQPSFYHTWMLSNILIFRLRPDYFSIYFQYPSLLHLLFFFVLVFSSSSPADPLPRSPVKTIWSNVEKTSQKPVKPPFPRRNVDQKDCCTTKGISSMLFLFF